MPELELIGGAPSNFVWACRIVLAEKGVPYTHVSVMPHTPEVDAIHPLGKIPAMRHGDVMLCESRAICGYIDRMFDGPALVPADPVAAAKVEQWVSIVCSSVDPLCVRQYLSEYVFPTGPDKTPDRAKIDAALPKMEVQFAMLDRAVAATGYLAGDTFTLADAYLMPILFYMKNRGPESGPMLVRFPNLTAYLLRHLARPSVQLTIPTKPPKKAA